MSGQRAPSPPRTTGFPEDTSALKGAFRAGRSMSEPVVGPEGFDPGAGTPVGAGSAGRSGSGGKRVEGQESVLDVLKKVADDRVGVPVAPSDAAAIQAAEQAVAEAQGGTGISFEFHGESGGPPQSGGASQSPGAAQAAAGGGPVVGPQSSAKGVHGAGSAGEAAELMAKRNVGVGVVVPSTKSGERGDIGGYAVEISKAPYAAPYTIGDALQGVDEAQLGRGVPVTQEAAQRVQRAEAQASPLGVLEKGGVAAHFQASADRNAHLEAKAHAAGEGEGREQPQGQQRGG